MSAELIALGGIAFLGAAVWIARQLQKGSKAKEQIKQEKAVTKAQEATLDAHETVERLDDSSVRDKLREHARKRRMSD